ncbi:MAG: hypothetical protein HZB26_03560 [Candidatus Hydrogenedentes bacterium]|nr:hypothetical protein [Candidatus Hydrogenedentota bacterium]
MSVSALLVAVVAVLGADTSAAPIDVSYRIAAAKGPYFFCDDRVVEDRWLLERFVVPPVRHPKNPLIVRDKPWEGTGPHMGGSVILDPQDHTYKMWYSVWNRHAYENKLPFSYNVCYAESDDGIAWRKPDLGVFDCEGSTVNNCIKLGTDKTQNIDVCLNPKPSAYPGRFLALHNQKGGLFFSSSDDGKTFKWLWDTPALSYHSDTHNNVVYDEVRDRWLLFCRPRAYAGYHKRRVSLTVSNDLQHWPHERTILVPSETDTPEFYGMTVFRRGDLFFGALQLYDKSTGYMQAELAWSGDGEHWSQVATHPIFVSRGPDGAWDAGMAMVAESPVVVGDEMRFYYGGFPLPHDTREENVAAIGLMTSERDRLVGVRPNSSEPGTIMTRPFEVKRRGLTLNAKVQGEVRAELRTDNNKAIAGYSFDDCDPVTASGFAVPVTWKGQPLAECAESEARIVFRLTRAELFTFDLVE